MDMDLHNRKVLVVGLGKTGISTARFLARHGADILVTDRKPPAQWKDKIHEIENFNINIQVRPYDKDVLSGLDMIIPSPGVPPSDEILSGAVRRGIPILSEIELASRFLKTPMIAITGTNGKTTTTSLIGEILKQAGKKVFVGGNIGNPLIDYVNGSQEDEYVVVEISSFQLQWIEQFHACIAILMNVTSDHIDYHGTFAEYRSIKERIFINQTGSDLAILNADEPQTRLLRKHLGARILCFSALKKIKSGMFLNHNTLRYNPFSGEAEEYPLGMIKIPGVHNIYNIMASVMTVRECGCPIKDIIGSVQNFRGIPHRIEYAGERGGVVFYDDSKGTNVGAVISAVETFSRPVILLMGGRDKEVDFRILSPLLREKVKELVLFGEARAKIYGSIGEVVKTVTVATLQEAVWEAYRHASAGDVVLLSPGCASFDEFKDYKERGEFFKKVVENLKE